MSRAFSSLFLIIYYDVYIAARIKRRREAHRDNYLSTQLDAARKPPRSEDFSRALRELQLRFPAFETLEKIRHFIPVGRGKGRNYVGVTKQSCKGKCYEDFVLEAIILSPVSS